MPLGWEEALGVVGRRPPELYRSAKETFGAPYGTAMRQGFQELGLSSYLVCNGKPLAAIIAKERITIEELQPIWKALWNQGLASALIVYEIDQVRIFSLMASPVQPLKEENDERLIDVLHLASDSLKVIREIIPSIEQGSFFEKHKTKLNLQHRVDVRLLNNLVDAVAQLRERGLTSNSAHALILQIIFIAYLEDREIINNKYISKATGNGRTSSLQSLLENGDVSLLQSLFRSLRNDFNGDVFTALCSFSPEDEELALTQEQMVILRDFRCGYLDTASGQYNLWPYDFKFIPVELISAIYDRLQVGGSQIRESGAYFTPLHLAQLCVGLTWEYASPQLTKNKSSLILDPACGSAVFLVCVFQRLIEEWCSNHQNQRPSWKVLTSIIRRLHGRDISGPALRLGILSLYIAMLEQAEPKDISVLIERGHLLPPLFNDTMVERDFFEEDETQLKYDLIIGNPPWVSRKKEILASAKKWCQHKNLPMPSKGLHWAFIWKSGKMLTPTGVTALLLPIMGVFLNQNDTVVSSRTKLFEKYHIKRVINLADICFDLFDKVKVPASFCVFEQPKEAGASYLFEYICPKSSPLLARDKVIMLASEDKSTIRSDTVINDPVILKKKMWGKNRDLRLLDYLADFPKLGDMAIQYKDIAQQVKSSSEIPANSWVIGQGFKPPGPKTKATGKVSLLAELPFLDMEDFVPWVLPEITRTWELGNEIHTPGFLLGFGSPHILIPQGIERNSGFLRASYSEQAVCFRHSIQSLWSPNGMEDANNLKILTAILNSNLIGWYLLLNAVNVGVERMKVLQEELLGIPFPLPNQSANPDIGTKIIEFIDSLMQRPDDRLLGNQPIKHEFLNADDENYINSLVYAYFGLKDHEIALVEDSINYILPSLQPTKTLKRRPPLWDKPSLNSFLNYAHSVREALAPNLQFDSNLKVTVHTGDDLIGVVEILLDDKVNDANAVEISQLLSSDRAQDLISELYQNWPTNIVQNISLVPDVTIFIRSSLYLIKPMRLRYWMKSTALNDADRIISDLLAFSYQTEGAS